MLGLCRAHVGGMLGTYWALCWTHIGPFVSHVGPMFGPMLGQVGPMLGLCWAHVGPMLSHVEPKFGNLADF